MFATTLTGSYGDGRLTKSTEESTSKLHRQKHEERLEIREYIEFTAPLDPVAVASGFIEDVYRVSRNTADESASLTDERHYDFERNSTDIGGAGLAYFLLVGPNTLEASGVLDYADPNNGPEAGVGEVTTKQPVTHSVFDANPNDSWWWAGIKGAGTGAKSVFNGGSNAVANLVTIGGLIADPADNPLKFGYSKYEKAIGAETAESIAGVSGEIIVGVGTGGLSQFGKVGKAITVADALGNAYSGAQAADNISKEGLTVGNSLQLAGSLLGTGSQLATVRLGNQIDGVLNKIDDAAAETAEEYARASRHAEPVACFVAGTPVLVHATMKDDAATETIAENANISGSDNASLLALGATTVAIVGWGLGKPRQHNDERAKRQTSRAALVRRTLTRLGDEN